MTIQELWKEGNRILSAAGITDGMLDARYLLEWVSGHDYSFLLLNPSFEVTEEVEQRYGQAIQLRKNHMPLQYITGEQEFMGISFKVNTSVLIPRQDTEILVETVMEHLQRWKARKRIPKKDHPMRILDLCCGSGCIGLSIWKMLQQSRTEMNDNAHPEDIPWQIELADVSSQALQVAEANAKGLHADVKLIETDLWSHLEGQYQIVVSNPPYIPSGVVDTLMPEVRDYEPRLALDGTEDGLEFYRRIIEGAKEYMEEEGYVFFEIGFDQADAVRQMLMNAGFGQIVVKQDLAGLDRVIYAKMTDNKPRLRG